MFSKEIFKLFQYLAENQIFKFSKLGLGFAAEEEALKFNFTNFPPKRRKVDNFWLESNDRLQKHLFLCTECKFVENQISFVIVLPLPQLVLVPILKIHKFNFRRNIEVIKKFLLKTLILGPNLPVYSETQKMVCPFKNGGNSLQNKIDFKNPMAHAWLHGYWNHKPAYQGDHHLWQRCRTYVVRSDRSYDAKDR